MSIGHWIVIIADMIFALTNIGSIVFNKEDRGDPEYVSVVIGVIVLTIFNIAAIAVR